ncbi:MAG: hypothetical protein FJY37_01260 [Betaproteobacteria bacterium]|nr:hypothetical protein [Betaproteobacteria bacterium]
MVEFEPDLGAGRMPVTILLGARGSGKTSVLNRIVRDLSRGPWGVIQNEKGATDAKGDWRELILGQMVPHAVGCLCCVGRSGLVDALRRFYALRSEESRSSLGRIVIETAHDADPAPVIQTLLNNALVTQYYRLGTVVCVVKADVTDTELAKQTHQFKQVVMADHIVITGAANVAPASLKVLTTRLRRLNPTTAISTDLPGDTWQDCGYHDILASGGALGRWLGCEAYTESGDLEGDLHAFSIQLNEPLEWPVFQSWLDAGLKLNADVIYRVRGALDVVESTGPVIIQGVQHVFQPPVQLPAWNAAERCTRMTFVTRDIDRESVLESLSRDLPIFAERVRARRWRHERSRVDPSLPA